MRRILVLGAGIYQVPLINTAKRMGLYVIVASIKGNYPGFELADKVYYEDTTNYKAILKIAKNEKISAIITTGTDVAMISVGYVCDHLKLHGIHYNAAIHATDKAQMKKQFAYHNVHTAKFYKVYNENELLNAYEKLSKPVILKVVDKSGSRGIVKVHERNVLLDAYISITKETSKDYILIEEFIEGIEFGIDAFIKDNKLILLLPHEKNVFQNGDTAVPLGHIFPYNVSNNIYTKIQFEMQKVCEALELNDCAVNVDAFLCNDEIYIIEAGARAGATGIPELISGYLGIDYYEMMIQTALGNEFTYEHKENGYWMSQILLSNKSGMITDISLPKMSKDMIKLDYHVGDYVSKFKNGPDRIGHVILHDKTREEVMKRMNRIIEQIQITVKE